MKIRFFTLSLCVVTFAREDGNSESGIKKRDYYIGKYRNEYDAITEKPKKMGFLRCKRHHFTRNTELYETRGISRMPDENYHGESLHQRNDLRIPHNREWHEIHGIPMPHESRNDGHRCLHFIHNREWHERHKVPMPDNTHHCTDTTTIRTAARPTYRPITRTTARTTGSPTESTEM